MYINIHLSFVYTYLALVSVFIFALTEYMLLYIGIDEHATFKKRCSTMLRWAINIYWIEKGYIPLVVRYSLPSALSEEGISDRVSVYSSMIHGDSSIRHYNTMYNVAYNTTSLTTKAVSILEESGYIPSVSELKRLYYEVCSKRICCVSRRFIRAIPRELIPQLRLHSELD